MDIVKLLSTNYPSARWAIVDIPVNASDEDNYNLLTFLDDTQKKTLVEYQAEWDILNLEIEKSARIAEIKALKLEKINDGITFNSHVYQSDDCSLINTTAAATNGNVTRLWYDKANIVHELSLEDIQAVRNLIIDRRNSCMIRKQELIDLVNGSTSIEKINNIDISIGWPD